MEIIQINSNVLIQFLSLSFFFSIAVRIQPKPLAALSRVKVASPALWVFEVGVTAGLRQSTDTLPTVHPALCLVSSRGGDSKANMTALFSLPPPSKECPRLTSGVCFLLAHDGGVCLAR